MKKFLALLFSTLFLVSLASCAKETAATETTSEDGTTVTEETTTNTTEDSTLVDLTEPIVLSIFSQKNAVSMPYEDMPVIQQLIEKNNIETEWEYVETDYEVRLNLLLTSGDLPDLFFCRGVSNSDIVNNIESFIPLDDLIKTYAPNIQMMLKNEPSVEQMATAYDGHIYGLPQVMPMRPDTYDTFFINQTWLDVLDLEIPTTTEEFREVLLAFVTEDPNGNGISDEIGYTGVFNNLNTLFSISYLLGSFGIAYDYTSDYLIVRDGELYFYPTMEDYKKGVEYLAGLWADGLLDIELFTQDWTQYTAKLKDPEVDKVGVSINWTIQNAAGGNEDRFVAIAPMEGPDGYQLCASNTDVVRANKNAALITSSNDYPERTMMFLNDCYDEETSLQLFYGSIPLCIEKSDTGEYTVLAPAEEGFSEGDWQWLNGLNDLGPMYVSRKFEENVTASQDIQKRLETNTMYTQYFVEERYPTVFYDMEDSEALSILITDINTYADQKFAEWIMNGTIEEEWDTYVTTLEEMGLGEMMEIYNRNYENANK